MNVMFLQTDSNGKDNIFIVTENYMIINYDAKCQCTIFYYIFIFITVTAMSQCSYTINLSLMLHLYFIKKYTLKDYLVIPWLSCSQ